MAAATSSLTPYHFVGDDGAITLRYADRIADGRGFNYNDGEAVNGCSNPLYTLALAGLLSLGMSPGTAVVLLAVVSLSAAAAVSFWAFARNGSFVAAVFVVVGLIAFDHTFKLLFSGLEPPFIFLLGTLLFAALQSRRRVLIGATLGLLVANKLDGALAAVAYTLVEVVRQRRFPLIEALVALVVALPIFAYELVSFGSILPNSVSTKIFSHDTPVAFDRLWMHRLMLAKVGVLYGLALASVLWFIVTRGRGWPGPLAVILLWLVLSAGLYTTVDLGAPFDWYSAAPVICSIILAAFVVERLAGRPSNQNGWRRRIVAVAATALVVWNGAPNSLGRWGPGQGGLAVPESANLARQAAGTWLRIHTDGTEELPVAYGLPAFEYGGPVYDLAALNTTLNHWRFGDAAYWLAGPRSPKNPLPWTSEKRVLVGCFQYDGAADAYWLFAMPDSQIVRDGRLHVNLPILGVERSDENAWRGNSVEIPVGKSRSLEAVAPAPPTLTLVAASSGGRLRLVVSNADSLLAELVLGRDSQTLSTLLPANGSKSSYELTFTVEPADSDRSDGGSALVSNVTLLVGEPVRASDLKLRSARREARLELAATRGLPWRAVER